MVRPVGETELAVQVEGLKEFRAALRQAGAQWPKELRQANEEAAEIAVPYVRRAAPKGPHEGGGRITPIEASIRATATQRAGFVRAGGLRTPHAAVLNSGGTIPRRGHGGTARKHVRGGFEAQLGRANVTRIPGRHYLERGIEAAADEVVEVYALTLDWITRKAFPS